MKTALNLELMFLTREPMEFVVGFLFIRKEPRR